MKMKTKSWRKKNKSTSCPKERKERKERKTIKKRNPKRIVLYRLRYPQFRANPKKALKAQKANAKQFVDAYNYVEEFDNILDAIEEYLDIEIDEDFMENHLMTIKSLLPVELQEFEQGPCQDGYVQIGVKEKGGRIVPNCVPEDNVGK